MSDEELEHRLAETRQELFNLRFQGATGALENTARLKLANDLRKQYDKGRSIRELAESKLLPCYQSRFAAQGFYQVSESLSEVV